MNTNKVRLGLIGAGGIAQAHINGILAHPDKVECVALCDVVDANIDKRANQLGTQPSRFADWKTMFATLGDQLDAVVICLPHHLHAPAILDAAAARKHVLCEKPMCINLAEADRIVETVKKAGIIYMSAHQQLFSPAVQAVKTMIDAGRLGRVMWLRVQDAHRAGADAFANKWRAKLASQGGGELIDTGYHPTYQLLYLANAEVAAIRATMGRFLHPLEGEDTAVVQVRFGNGAIGEIFTSWAMPRPYGAPDIHVIGDKGEAWCRGWDVGFLALGSTEPELSVVEGKHAFNEQMGYFADCILTGAQVPHGPEIGREVLRVILEASANAEGWQAAATNG
jgi:predicted dehydrogenase